MTGSARAAALECIVAVAKDDAYANLVMPAILARARLDARDSGFATELAYGTLRMQGLYDAIISRAAGRSPESLDFEVLAILRLGAHQLVGMTMPPHAAVSETVDLARGRGLGRAAGFVNAVMRRISEKTPDAWLATVAPGVSRGSRAIRTSHPEWIVAELERSLAAHGLAGEIDELLEAHNTPAKVTLVARPGLVDREALVNESGGKASALSPYGVTLDQGSPGRIRSVADGRAGVQDEGSQIVAAALAESRPLVQGETWLDACSGPGGKTALLGSIAASAGVRIEATELHEHRTELVRQACRALPVGIVTVSTADATVHTGGPYDRILLDAPCTGLGALRRRPEARWRKNQADLDELTMLQSTLLKHAATLLAPDGILAYVTCSPVLAETRDIVRASGLELVDARPAVARVTGTSADRWGVGPDVQLWTHRDGTDSMYLALLKAPASR